MRNIRFILFVLPWVLVMLILTAWYLGLKWPGRRGAKKTEVINSTTLLTRIEELGKLELVRYNYHELYDYKALSHGKAAGSALLRLYNSEPDLKAVLIASGEAVGCIDLRKIKEKDIYITSDTLYLHMPDPELCYYKLNLDKTHVYDFERKGWWSRLFPDDTEMKSLLEAAYREAEQQIKESALENGILEQTRQNGEKLLKPMMERMTGKLVFFSYQPDSMNITY